MLDLEESSEVGIWPVGLHVDVWVWRAHHHFHRLALDIDTGDHAERPISDDGHASAALVPWATPRDR